MTFIRIPRKVSSFFVLKVNFRTKNELTFRVSGMINATVTYVQKGRIYGLLYICDGILIVRKKSPYRSAPRPPHPKEIACLSCDFLRMRRSGVLLTKTPLATNPTSAILILLGRVASINVSNIERRSNGEFRDQRYYTCSLGA